jgi:hypothetical protein
MFEKVSFRPTDGEKSYLEELYLRSGAKTMTEFWHVFLQDAMTQKGSNDHNYRRADIILSPKQGEIRTVQDNFSVTNPTAVLLQAQKAHYEQQLQRMYLEIQALNNQVAYLQQQYQWQPQGQLFTIPSPYTHQTQAEYYSPWPSYQPSYPFPSGPFPNYYQMPYLYRTEPESADKDFWEIMTDNLEKAAKFRNAVTSFRNIL